ncbi:MAG: HAMP domain-containing sensor histidine kinase [Campylobacterota bacterium]|nr:HAMP domain-containing sensor histidine kinase [Campylobacterota bacterium]
MNTNSIYKQFSQKLIYATSFFIIVLSLIFYGFTKSTVYEEISEELIKDAKLIVTLAKSQQNDNTRDLRVLVSDDTTIEVVTLFNLEKKINLRKFRIDQNHFIELIYPLDLGTNRYLKMVKNINSSNKMLNKIFGNLLFLGIGGIVLVIIYAFAVSKTLLFPILKITRKLSNMNENSLEQIKIEKLPLEFIPLANSINTLTTRIQGHVKYQKELFIGAAHELKTPLAVMKLKSQVTLRKPRDQEKYEEVLNLFINEIDGMNQMISSILDMGRQEGAQFEKPHELNIITYMVSKTESFKLLASQKNINIIFETKIDNFITIIQETMLTQIIQNFIQNAIKFTPEGKNIVIKAISSDDSLTIKVIDEGIGCDESVDLFAPFKRVGDEKGAGLGLFLAKSAADTIGGVISLKNRDDGTTGTVATLKLQTNPTCQI